VEEYPLSCPARGLEKDEVRSDHLSFGVACCQAYASAVYRM